VTRSLKIIPIKELAVLVSQQLKKYGIEAVLTGGSCVTIFSGNKYQSLDLDFVTAAVEYKPKEIVIAMKELGFRRKPEGFFEHPNCKYVVEFIPPPLAIGREPVQKTQKNRTKNGIFLSLSPTDCVKDRLAAFYFWDDLQSLEQAKMVVQAQKINFAEVKRWSRIEGQMAKYNLFLKEIKKI